MEGLSALIEVIVQPCHVGDGTSPEALAPVHGILDYDGKHDKVLHKMVKNTYALFAIKRSTCSAGDW